MLNELQRSPNWRYILSPSLFHPRSYPLMLSYPFHAANYSRTRRDDKTARGEEQGGREPEERTPQPDTRAEGQHPRVLQGEAWRITG